MKRSRGAREQEGRSAETRQCIEEVARAHLAGAAACDPWWAEVAGYVKRLERAATEVVYLQEQVRVLAERIGTLEEVFVLMGVPLPEVGAGDAWVDEVNMVDAVRGRFVDSPGFPGDASEYLDSGE